MPGLSLFLLAAFALPQTVAPQDAAGAGVPVVDFDLSFKDLVGRVYDPSWMLHPVNEGEFTESYNWQLDGEGHASITLQGQGAVARIWLSAATGTIRIFADGAAEPAITWDLEALLASDLPAHLSAPFFMQVGRGFVCRIPLPFQKDMRLDFDAAATSALYGDLDVRRFGKGVTLPSLQADTLADNLRSLRYGAQVLRDNANPETVGEPPFTRAGSFHYNEPSTVEGADYFYGDFRVPILGDGVLQWFEIEFYEKLAPDEMRELLRSLTLRLELNTEKAVIVGDIVFEVPLGDFFGTAPGLNPFQSHLIGYNEQTGVFYFRMPVPFTGGLKISLSSDDPKLTFLKTRWGVNKYAKPEHVPPMRLHSGWIRSSAKGVPNAAQLDIPGQARLLGYTFSATAPVADAQDFSGPFDFVKAWQGTTPMSFEHLTLREGPGSFGHMSALRLFGLDAPTGENGLSFDPGITLAQSQASDYSALAWWYAPANSTSSFQIDAPFAQRWPLMEPEPNFFHVAGAFECEGLDGLLMSEGSEASVITALDSGEKWSRLQFLDWLPAEANQVLNFPFPVKESGKYDLFVQFAKGEKYGKVQALIDGKRLGEEMDMNGSNVVPSGELKIGAVRLMQRLDHKIAFLSSDGKAVGIDYFRFEAVAKPTDSDNNGD